MVLPPFYKRSLMKRKSRLALLLVPNCGKLRKKASSERTTAAAPVARNGSRPTQASCVMVPRKLVVWLRTLPISRPISPVGDLARQAAKLGLVRLGKKVFCMTTPGLRAAHSWAIDFGFRSDRRLWEGFCAHGTGHPINFASADKTAGVHHCCGCCNRGD